VYVPRLARREDFGRILEGVSSSAESVHARDWSKQHQGRRGTYMATPADRSAVCVCVCVYMRVWHQVWGRARATSSVVVVFMRQACGPRCSISS